MREILFALLWLLVGQSGACATDAFGNSRLDHSGWNQLLQQYETPQARVDYRATKSQGLGDLNRYLKQVAALWPKDLAQNERKAALINAYNALTVNWVVQNYPVPSIWRTSHPFTTMRHMVDGHMFSLDQIETELRNMGDPRVHGAIVCASLSCPPLRREAYAADRLDAQLDDNMRAWLANKSLNNFDPSARKAKISMIFNWYKRDFEKAGSTVPAFLSRFAPAGQAGFLREAGLTISYQPYRWGVNDVSGIGNGYSQTSFLADYLRNKL